MWHFKDSYSIPWKTTLSKTELMSFSFLKNKMSFILEHSDPQTEIRNKL